MVVNQVPASLGFAQHPEKMCLGRMADARACDRAPESP
jgi:hypothetical protein